MGRLNTSQMLLRIPARRESQAWNDLLLWMPSVEVSEGATGAAVAAHHLVVNGEDVDRGEVQAAATAPSYQAMRNQHEAEEA